MGEATETKVLIDKIMETFSSLRPEERAYMVIKGFLGTECPSDRMRDEFNRWMLESHNREAKRAAMERVAIEYFEWNGGVKATTE
jgi:hypothetical protein